MAKTTRQQKRTAQESAEKRANTTRKAKQAPAKIKQPHSMSVSDFLEEYLTEEYEDTDTHMWQPLTVSRNSWEVIRQW